VELLALKKDKYKKGQRLNLYNKESTSVKIYLLSKVVKAKEYIIKKNTKEKAKNKAKEARKV
jgi:hypothetical protein